MIEEKVTMTSGIEEAKRSEFLSALQRAVENGDYARAVRVAQAMGRSAQEMKELQQKALEQFIVESRNPQGTLALAKEYGFTRDDLNKVLQKILEDARDKKIIERRQYDTKTMRYLNLEEWIKEHLMK